MAQSFIFRILILTCLLRGSWAWADVFSNLQIKAVCGLHYLKCKNCLQKPPQILEMALLSCQAVARSEFCQELVKKEPEFYGKTKLCTVEDFCADHMTQEIDSLKMCGQGFLEGNGETISELIDVLNNAWLNIEKKNKLISIFNQSVEYKREMVRDIPKFQKLSDEQLNRFTAAALQVELDNFTYNQSVIARHSVKTLLPSERAEEAERRQGSSVENMAGSEKRMIRGVRQWMKNKMARLECLDAKTQAEMICWGAAWIIDPLFVAGAAKKGIRAARYVKDLTEVAQPPPMAIMQSNSRKDLVAKLEKDAEFRKLAMEADERVIRSMTPPGVDSAKLRRNVNHVWAEQGISTQEKVSGTFDEYIRLRSEKLNREQKKRAQEALGNIKKIPGENAGYYRDRNQIVVGDPFTDEALVFYSTVVHEFEHLTQKPLKLTPPKAKVVKDMDEKLNTLMTKVTAERKTSPPAQLGEFVHIPSEFGAIGAQWDFLQAIPEDVRRETMRRIRKNPKLSEGTKSVLIKDLEMASLNREDYLRTVPKYHQYSHLNTGVIAKEEGLPYRMLVIYGTAAAAAAGAADFFYDK